MSDYLQKQKEVGLQVAADLVRSKGCICDLLEKAEDFQGGRGTLYPNILVHDHRCPESLAAAIEARGRG